MNQPELKPCHACASAGEFVNEIKAYARCSNGLCYFHKWPMHTEAWNTRANDTELQGLRQLQEALRVLASDVECYCAENTAANGPCGYCVAPELLRRGKARANDQQKGGRQTTHDADCGYSVTGHIHNCSCGVTNPAPKSDEPRVGATPHAKQVDHDGGQSK